ncbi:glycosyltransferase [Pseudidiomarina salilacus]|uniref:glycosyltransferase n=1 Tax=Pseudidiomarina salilacus TaxID=3384452 RepID=UPI003984BF86
MVKKVFFVVTALEVGGLENYLLRFLTYAGSQIEPYIVCERQCNSTSLIEKFESLDVKVITLKNEKSIFSIIELAKLIRTIRPKILCDFRGSFAAKTLICGSLFGVTTRISFFRESRYQFKKTVFRNFVASVSLFLTRVFASQILFNSKCAAEYFFPSCNYTSPQSKYKVIYNSVTLPDRFYSKVEARLELGLCPNSKYLLNVGRHVDAKNHSFILETFKQLVERDDKVRLVLIGKNVNGVLSGVNRSVSDKILCIEHSDLIYMWLMACDVFFFPSKNEGLPNALIEACLAKIHVIASDIEPCKEVLGLRGQSHLVDNTDVASALVSILKFMDAPLSHNEKLMLEEVEYKFGGDKNFKLFLNVLQGDVY